MAETAATTSAATKSATHSVTAQVPLVVYDDLQDIRHGRRLDKFSDLVREALTEYRDNHADEISR